MCSVWIVVFFFFSSRRRHTRFKCDWSSDVCSSDLEAGSGAARRCLPAGRPFRRRARGGAGDRKSVVEGKRVDLGGRRIIKKKKNKVDWGAGWLGRCVLNGDLHVSGLRNG